MSIKRIELGWIQVKDFLQAKKFFIEKVGLGLSGEDSDMGWVEVKGPEGGLLLGIAQAHKEESACCGGEEAQHIKNVILCLNVDNIEESKKELEAKAVRFIGDIIEVPGHVKMVSFLDPDNNMFQLIQRLD